MREIKIRGLYKGQWYYFNISDLLAINPESYTDYDWGIANHDPNTRGEYTGLKDKNGKEIYEGDIVIFDNTEIGGNRYKGQVIFNRDQTLSNLEWGLWLINGGYLRTDFLGEIEIIGNIHQSPELLDK